MNPIKSLTYQCDKSPLSSRELRVTMISLVAFNRRSGLVNSFTMEVMAIPARSLENIQGEPGAPPGQSHEMAKHGAVKGESYRIFTRTGSAGSAKDDVKDFANSPVIKGQTQIEIAIAINGSKATDNEGDPLAALDCLTNGAGPFFELKGGSGRNAKEFADAVSSNELIIAVQSIHALNHMQPDHSSPLSSPASQLRDDLTAALQNKTPSGKNVTSAAVTASLRPPSRMSKAKTVSGGGGSSGGGSGEGISSTASTTGDGSVKPLCVRTTDTNNLLFGYKEHISAEICEVRCLSAYAFTLTNAYT